jgi:large subunit ribosomal protein L19e
MKLQKRLAADILKCGEDRVRLDTENSDKIKGAITKFDIRKLIAKKIIKKIQAKGISRVRIRAAHKQKQKGRQRGPGSRKGPATSRINPKRQWMNSVRIQRKYLNQLKHQIPKEKYQELYAKVTGRFFRSINHLKLFIKQ